MMNFEQKCRKIKAQKSKRDKRFIIVRVSYLRVHLVSSHLKRFSTILGLCTSLTPRPLLKSFNINIKTMMEFESIQFKGPYHKHKHYGRL